jgi:nicotinamidase-related amidase
MKSLLLLIDIQNDYFPNGNMQLNGSIEAGVQAGKALKSFRDRGLPVVHIQHTSSRPGATFLLPDTHGVEIHVNVKPLPGETIIRKSYPNSFRDTDLLEHIKSQNISELTICGMMTHMCVDSTVRAAFDHGFLCTVLSDACATRGLKYDDIEILAEHVNGAFLAALSPVFATLSTVEDFLDHMNQTDGYS